MKLKPVLALSLFVLLVAGGFLWYAFSPLLFDVEVQDELSPALKAKLEAIQSSDQSGTEDENSATNEQTEDEVIQVVTKGPFPITSTPGHPATGQVAIISSPEETVIQYQNYDGTNGPDLYIYLAKDLEAKEYVDLGRQRGNKGNISYAVPADVDLSEYKYILTWCKAFGVLFDYVEIN